MTALEDLVQAAMSAPPERREEALRLLQGQVPKPEAYLTLSELARRLGVCRATLRRWRVPGHDLGGYARYRLSEVEAYFRTEAFRRRQGALRAERRGASGRAGFHFGDGLLRPGRRQQPLNPAGTLNPQEKERTPMAILTQPATRSNPFTDRIGDDLAPVGTQTATVIDIKDAYGVQRTKFESDELEKVDLTCFLFGFRDAQGNPHMIASRQMRISGNEKSALFGFLKNMLGRAPEYGWDYCALKGQKCLLTVEHVQKRDGSGVFAGIASLSPIPPGFGQPVTVPAAPQPRPQPAPIPSQAPAPLPTARQPAPLPGSAAQRAPVQATDDDDVPF